MEQLRGYVGDGRLPLASIRIARLGRVLAEAHFPGAETVGADSVYRIYSMTKPVVAAGVVLLVEDGRLSLEDPVTKFVPEFADPEVMDATGKREPARSMTLAQLLSHSCGLGNSWGDARVASLYRDALVYEALASA